MINEQMTDGKTKDERGEGKGKEPNGPLSNGPTHQQTAELPTLPKQTQVWEQMEGEPTRLYNQFQIYRDLGPNRTVRKAYAKYHGENWKRVANNRYRYWREICTKWEWRERANEFDKTRLAQEGDEAIVHFMGGLKQAAAEVHQALERVKPKTWREAMEGLNLVGSFISQATIDQATGAGDQESARAVGGGEGGTDDEDEEED